MGVWESVQVKRGWAWGLAAGLQWFVPTSTTLPLKLHSIPPLIMSSETRTHDFRDKNQVKSYKLGQAKKRSSSIDKKTWTRCPFLSKVPKSNPAFRRQREHVDLCEFQASQGLSETLSQNKQPSLKEQPNSQKTEWCIWKEGKDSISRTEKRHSSEHELENWLASPWGHQTPREWERQKAQRKWEPGYLQLLLLLSDYLLVFLPWGFKETTQLSRPGPRRGEKWQDRASVSYRWKLSLCCPEEHHPAPLCVTNTTVWQTVSEGLEPRWKGALLPPHDQGHLKQAACRYQFFCHLYFTDPPPPPSSSNNHISTQLDQYFILSLHGARSYDGHWGHREKRYMSSTLRDLAI